MSTVKERPILMSGEMVRAILDGRKHQTRRVVNPQPIFSAASGDSFEWHGGKALVKAGYGAPYVHSNWTAVERAMLKVSPYVVGQRLWVKETWRVDGVEPPPGNFTKRLRVAYRADGCRKWFEQGEWPNGSILDPERWTPSIFMPRWASRLTLEITNVRVERLQDIDEDDAESEGVLVRFDDHPEPPAATAQFQRLWDSINGKGAWDKNPYVWAVSFKRL